jgi:hypothetical protein
VSLLIECDSIYEGNIFAQPGIADRVYTDRDYPGGPETSVADLGFFPRGSNHEAPKPRLASSSSFGKPIPLKCVVLIKDQY